MIHGYDLVDWKEVWKTAAEDVPDLLKDLQSLLPKKPEDGSGKGNGL